MVLVYHCYWHEIQEQDHPEPGMVYMCLDSQKRLGRVTWSVSVMGDGTIEGDIVQHGLFWNEEDAFLFANALAEKVATKV